MMSMYNNLTAKGDARRNEMRPLFTLTPAETKKALSAISSNASAKSMALAQRSVMTRHLLSSRLNEAFIPEPVKVKLPESNLDGGSGRGLDVSLKLCWAGTRVLLPTGGPGCMPVTVKRVLRTIRQATN